MVLIDNNTVPKLYEGDPPPADAPAGDLRTRERTSPTPSTRRAGSPDWVRGAVWQTTRT